jgi:hypothetical protein
MSSSGKLMIAVTCVIVMTGGSSCRVWNNMFGPKYGCPANGRSFGSERILSGEKPPKAKKFKA